MEWELGDTNKGTSKEQKRKRIEMIGKRAHLKRGVLRPGKKIIA